jgi:acetyl esterase/lipase
MWKSLALVLAVSLSCAVAAEKTPAVRSFPDVVFAKVGKKELRLDLFVPKSATPSPLVIYIHGGAWVGGDRKNPPVMWLVDSGFAVASIDYRFSMEAPFPAQIFDCKAAVRWLRAHAAEYGYAADKMAVLGDSAGGHLAVILGTTGDVSELEGDVGGNVEQSSRVQAIVDFYGPTDFILRSKTQPEMTDPPDSRVHRLLGSAPKDNPAAAKLASGAFQVSKDDPPLLIFHGDADKTVLMNQSVRLRDAYKTSGLDVEMVIVAKAGHGIEPFLTPENKKLIVEFLNGSLR